MSNMQSTLQGYNGVDSSTYTENGVRVSLMASTYDAEDMPCNAQHHTAPAASNPTVDVK